MAEQVVVLGGGGFGRETIDVVRAINAAAGEPVWELRGVVDDGLSDLHAQRLRQLGVPILGGMTELDAVPRSVWVAAGVGNPAARYAIAERLDALGFRAPSLVHPSAVIGSSFSYGDGLVVCAQATVGTNVALGRHVHVNPHAVIGHDADIKSFVSINPNATVSGECRIGTRTLVGAAAVVLQGLEVGRDVIVGAAACVVSRVSDSQTVVGVPAAPIPKGRRTSVTRGIAGPP